ncbi:hypothetical protein FEE95_00590 [Maribacter algarum]|uniref:Uncharacterized protein n=1 Tax=Maribacter algarum (ex Zhang et al. 2020) TaxID=2578118 RepID=A0A5S3PSJ4_9FLAO|nr:hypothetical protein [Maribacter algarum]TMM57959.1 hypothetical protein FEE95_00590 [Maribacter algarum]
MNTTWYIGTLIILLALIGFNQEPAKVANQQIVLQFTDAEITSVAAHDDALSTVTKKLQALGITDIEIIKNDGSHLSIHYYSVIDARSIGELLSQDIELSLIYGDVDQLPVDFPKDKLPETCNIVVSDLQQQTNDGFGLNGKLAFELKQDYQRFSNPPVVKFNDLITLEQGAIVKVAYKINRSIAIAIDNTSRSIPEVRAGPFTYGSS